MRAIKLIAIASLLALSQTTLAKGCSNVVREDELLGCLSEEFALADKELNVTYLKLRSAISKDTVELLVKAQRLWVSLRDADCEFEAESHRGGTGYQAIYVQCQTDKTRQRIKDLKGSIFWPRG